MNRSNKTWVKNMCQTFENIFMDVDKFVCKEPVLFVGNQMETVGENVKNFFSGFVDDFVLAQVVDPVRHVAQLVPSKSINLAETSTSSAVEIEENTVDSNTNNPNEAPLVPKELRDKPSSTGLCHSQQSTSEISAHLIGEQESSMNKTSDNTTEVNLNSSTNSQTLEHRAEEVLYDESVCGDATAFEYSDWGIENIIDLNLDTDYMIKEDPSTNLEEETLLNSPSDELECDSNSSTTHQSSELEGAITCNENKEENANHIIAGGDLSSEKLCESFNSPFKNSIVAPEIECNPTKTVDYLSLSPDILSSCGSLTTLAYDSDNEAYVSCSGTGLADVSTVNLEDIKNDTDVESCVIVEHGKLSCFPNPSRSKSYKKMIQDAFMSRKRLTKEYKQLAIWYGDIDKELCQPTKLSGKQPVHDLPDSEWELL